MWWYIDHPPSGLPRRRPARQRPRPGAPRPHAVVQLRAENRYGTSYNLVGFQTRLAYPEQQRIFRMIPGLQRAARPGEREGRVVGEPRRRHRRQGRALARVGVGAVADLDDARGRLVGARCRAAE